MKAFYAALAFALLGSLTLHVCGSSDTPSTSPSSTPTPSVPSVILRSGAAMPMLSAGTWLYNESVAEAAVVAAIAAGFTHIDTAFDYSNQQGVRRGIAKSGKAREDLFITTKIPGCGLQTVSGESVEKCKNDSAARLADDLEQLGLSYIDLVLIHFPPCAGADGSAAGPDPSLTCVKRKTGCTDPASCNLVKTQWKVLTDAYKEGKVRSIGVSNYCSACLKCLEADKAIMPMVNQVQFHVGMGPDPQGFRSYAESHDIKLQAWSPLGHGGAGSDEILKGNLTTSIGKKYGKSAVQVALKWLLSHNISVATKSSNPIHLTENLEVFDFDFKSEDMTALDTADFAQNDTPSFLCDDNVAPSQANGFLSYVV